VAAAAYRNEQAPHTSELDGSLNIGHACASRNQRWSSVDVPVPNSPGDFVPRVPTRDQLAAKNAPKILKGYGVDRSAIRLKATRSQHHDVSTSECLAGLTVSRHSVITTEFRDYPDVA